MGRPWDVTAAISWQPVCLSAVVWATALLPSTAVGALNSNIHSTWCLWCEPVMMGN